MIKFTSRIFLSLLLVLFASPCVKADEPLGRGTIWTAAQQGDVTTIKKLMRQNPKLANARRVVGRGTADQVDWTPLSLAAVAGKTEAAAFLLSHGADVDLRRSNDNTPLYDVVLWGGESPNQLAVARLLIAKGANVNATASNGFTPLNYVKGAALAKLLLDKGAKVNGHNNVHGMSPIQTFAKYLLPIMARNNESYAQALSLIQLFIARGANLNYKDKAGKRAADYAQKVVEPKRRQQIVKLLAGHKAR